MIALVVLHSDLYPEDVEKLASYKAQGLSDHEAAMQVAQDTFGPSGVIVQHVDVVER